MERVLQILHLSITDRERICGSRIADMMGRGYLPTRARHSHQRASQILRTRLRLHRPKYSPSARTTTPRRTKVTLLPALTTRSPLRRLPTNDSQRTIHSFEPILHSSLRNDPIMTSPLGLHHPFLTGYHLSLSLSTFLVSGAQCALLCSFILNFHSFSCF